jgi:hypothetical protein
MEPKCVKAVVIILSTSTLVAACANARNEPNSTRGRAWTSFQQVHKYEKGANRIGASRLQQISQILQVPIPFFFEGVPGGSGATMEITESDSYVNDFLATSDGMALVKAFMHIKNLKLRRAVVRPVEQITPKDALLPVAPEP